MFFQAEDGIRYLVRSRGLGDVYKRQDVRVEPEAQHDEGRGREAVGEVEHAELIRAEVARCLLYTSDAADERSSVDLGGGRIIKQKMKREDERLGCVYTNEETLIELMSMSLTQLVKKGLEE